MFLKDKFSSQEEKIEIPQVLPRKEEVLRDLLAPAAVEVAPNYLKLGSFYAKTFFVFSYAKYLDFGWLQSLISLNEIFDLSIFFHPIDTSQALKQLRKKIAQIEAQIIEDEEKGKVRDPSLEIAQRNIERLRDALQSAEEKLFHVSLYVTIWAEDLTSLKRKEQDVLLLFKNRMIYVKPAIFQHLEGVNSTFPLGVDELEVYNTLDTLPASAFFPFVSADLSPGLFFKGSEEEAILYGINIVSQSPVIFDRFSLENANMLILATSGAGKSYFAKLEIIRSLMLGREVIIIDPENEYKLLSEKLGGSFFPVSIASEYNINPFDLPREVGESTEELLKSNILDLTTLLKMIIKDITSGEEAVLDRAILETYRSRDITPETDLSKGKIEFPTLSDLAEVLYNMEGGKRLAENLYPYTKGSFAGFLNQPTNVDLTNKLVVFSLRDLEEELRPIAMFLTLNFIWKAIRGNPKRRLVLIDEAWYLMKYPDSANFLAGLAKRGRKYQLGLTVITQNISDFLNSPYGMPIISNSALQMLMKQSPANVDLIQKTFHLSSAAKALLPQLDVGEGIFIAGLRQALIKVVSSYVEHEIASTSRPQPA